MNRLGRFSSVGGLTALLIGVSLFHSFVLMPLQESRQMQHWHIIPAELLEAQVVRYQDENETAAEAMYKLTARYAYKINGQYYTGNRVIVADSLGSNSSGYHELLSEIHQLQQSPEGFRVRVNPEQPAQAIIFPRPDWTVPLMMGLFSSIFILLGGGHLLYSLYQAFKQLRVSRADPTRPWTTQAEWNSPTVYSNAKSRFGSLILMALIAAMFLSLGAIAFYDQLVIRLAFFISAAVVTALAGYKAWKEYRAWQIVGKAPVTLTPYPGVIGGSVGGSLRLSRQCKSAPPCHITLECIRYRTVYSGKNTRTEQEVIWASQQRSALTDDAEGSLIRFDFKVPGACRPSTPPGDSYHKWVVNVRVEVAGVNFDRDYEIPVFITDASQLNEQFAEDQTEPLTLDETVELYDALSIGNEGSGLSLKLKGAQVKTGWLLAAVGGLMMSVIGYAAFASGTVPNTFVVLFSGAFIAAGGWLSGRHCYVRVTAQQCTVHVHWFSRLVRECCFKASEISDIEVYRSSNSRSQWPQKREYHFSLRLQLESGQTLELGGALTSRDRAEYIRQEMLDILESELDS
ncbi:MAG: DUF3592 domain-containing protein [Amphritea sp.]|nr:DUF3592 domain-containing protein [Amphritea sp.]